MILKCSHGLRADKRLAYCSTLALSPGLPAAAAPLPTVVQRPVRVETPNLGYCRVKLSLTNLAQCCWWRSRARPSAGRRGRPCSCWRTSRPASRSWRPCRPRPSACGHACVCGVWLHMRRRHAGQPLPRRCQSAPCDLAAGLLGSSLALQPPHSDGVRTEGRGRAVAAMGVPVDWAATHASTACRLPNL